MTDSRPRYQSRQDAPAIPTPRKISYYRDKILISELVDDDAEKVAAALKEIPPTQLRRFYEHVVSIRRRLDAAAVNPSQREAEFLKLRPEFKLLKAKAVYTHGRQGNNDKHKYQPLTEFFVNHTHSVATAADFDAFCKHFEAVIAFHKFLNESKEK